MTPNQPAISDRTRPQHPLLAVLLVVSCLGFSTLFACATPFAALATLAALNCMRRDALLLIGLAWLGNQAVGFGLLHYPVTWDTIAWGGAIGVGAVAGVMAARAVPARQSVPLQAGSAFLAAFASYELVLYAASFVLPGGEAGFSARVILYVFEVNAIGMAILWAAFLAVAWLMSQIERPLRSMA